MNTEILNILLRQNGITRDWERIKKRLKPEIAEYVKIPERISNIKDKELIPVYKFFDTLDDTLLKKNGQLISISTQPLGGFVPYHIHDYVEIMVVLLGNCTVRTETEVIPMTQDEIIIMGNRTAHRVDKIDNGTIVVNIALRDSAFSLNELNYLNHNRQAQNISSIMFSLLTSDNSHGAFNLFHVNHEPKIVNTVYDIISEYYQADSHSNQIIHLELLELIVRLIRVAATNPVLQIQKQSKSDRGIDLLTLLLYIEKEYSSITLDKMAKHFGFNPNYLSSFLKKKTGYTFIKLVHLQRVNAAAEYLAYTNVPIEKISLKVGYENPSYFYKVFKKIMGCSPAEYRANY